MKGRRKTDHRTRVGKERSARTETRILEAALGVFAERGPDGPVIDDFVQAAGISRGTFYNHFRSVEELLTATSEWTTAQVIESIEDAIENLDEPTLRLGVGLRMFFAHAIREPVWAGFVARVWKLGGFELPARDLEVGVRLGRFRVPSPEAAHALVFGATREALHHIGSNRVAPEFANEMAAICLHALRAEPRRVAAALAHPLPGSDGPVANEPAGAVETRGPRARPGERPGR